MAYLKRPEPGPWQEAADKYQALWLRRYTALAEDIRVAAAVRLAADFGEHGASDRPDLDVGAVWDCISPATAAALIIPTRPPADRPAFDFPVGRFDPLGLFTVKDRRRAR